MRAIPASRRLALGVALILGAAYLVQLAPHAHPDGYPASAQPATGGQPRDHGPHGGHAHAHANGAHAHGAHAHGHEHGAAGAPHHHHAAFQHLDDHAVRHDQAADHANASCDVALVPAAAQGADRQPYARTAPRDERRLPAGPPLRPAGSRAPPA